MPIALPRAFKKVEGTLHSYRFFPKVMIDSLVKDQELQGNISHVVIHDDDDYFILEQPITEHLSFPSKKLIINFPDHLIDATKMRVQIVINVKSENEI